MESAGMKGKMCTSKRWLVGMLKKIVSKIEILGLIVIFFASLFQVVATDWWDKQIVEWEVGIRQRTDDTILHSISRLTDIVASPNTQSKLIGRDLLLSDIGKSRRRIQNDYNDRREEIENGQYALFQAIRNWLFLVGSFLVLGSKLLNRIISKYYKI